MLKLKKKLGLCLYEDISDEQDLILMWKEICKEEKVFTQHDIENKQLKVESEKLKKRRMSVRNWEKKKVRN